MKEKVLTYNIVKELGLDKISVITADMLEGYTTIGYSAFLACTGLTSITIPNSVTSIGDWAFSGCSGLTSVTISGGVTAIELGAFCGCRSLTSIEIPNTITSIGYNAFDGCSGLKSVHTSDIAAWCAISFENHLANPLYYAHNLYLNSKLITDLVIPNSVTSIGNYAFENCSGLTGELVIPNSVTSIGHSTFYYCRGLKSITIPNGITSIGTNVFFGCSGLTSVKIGNSVTSIGCSAFCYCTDLASVTIGDKTYKKQTVTNGKCKAYKAFKSDMTCRDFQYKEGETYEFDGTPELCRCGFHASLCLLDVFNYYYGKLGKDIVVHEVELEGVSDKKREDSKVVANKIKIGKRIL